MLNARVFWFALLVLSVFPALAWAQNGTVRGFVRDAGDGQPLQGVNIILMDGGDGFYGAATNNDGFYAISRVPPGRYAFRATYIGYQTYTDTLDVVDGVQTYTFEIQFAESELEEVIVEGEREAAGAAALTAGLQTVRPEEIELVPTPDVSGDLVNYLTTMPGVVTAGDQGGQIFVRGGEPTHNLVLLDGMLVYQPFHLIGFYSAFPSEIINTSDVYAGGFGAKYGGRLSSVIDVSARTGNKRRFAGSVAVSPFMSGARLEGPLVRDRASILLSGRTSVIEQGVSNYIDTPLPYQFDDQFGKLHINLSQNHQASVTALRTFDRGNLGRFDTTTTDLNLDQVVWENTAVGARYILLPTNLPILAEIMVSGSKIKNEFGPPDSLSRASSTQQFQGLVNVTHFLGNTDVNWGIYVRSTKLESQLGGQLQNITTNREYVTEAGGYFEPEFRLRAGSGFRIQPGLRFQTFPSKGRTFVEPRIRLVFDYGIHRFSAAWGLYHQEIVGLSDRRDAGDVFTAWTSSPLGVVPEAMHIIGGYQIRLVSGVEFALEGFYKKLSNLSVAEWTPFPRFTTALQPANGDAYGLDVRLEVSMGRFYGFANYGYAKVTYNAMQETLPIWYGVDQLEYSPPHDRRHQANILGSLEVYGFNFNVRWQYGSGLPFSESLGFDEFVLLEGPTPVQTEPGDTRVLYDLPYKGRLPDYHRLDISLDRTFSASSNIDVTLQAGVTNAYDRKNVFYVDLFTLRRLDQLPRIPTVGLKVDFK